MGRPQRRGIQALGERRKRLPEILRPCIDDLIKFLSQMLPSQIPEFIKLVLGWLKLSSKELLAALLAFGRHLPDNFAFVACVHPSAYQQCGQDIHKLLQSFVLEPKKRAQSKRAQAKRKAASAKTKTSTGTPRKQRSSQQAPDATATAADSATASATTSKAQAAAQPSAATQPMAAPPTAPDANSVHLELEDLMDLAAADQQSAPTATPTSAPTLVPERAVAPNAALSQPAALSGDADTSVPVTATGEPDGAAGPTFAPTEPFAAQAETPVPAAQSGVSAPMAPMAPASDADVSALSADADDDDADDEEIEQVVAQLLARVEVQAEQSATRKREQHERKQRKADHKRERKQRQAQRRRK